MGKHVVQKYFDTYPEGQKKYFETEEKARRYAERQNEKRTSHLVSWEYRGKI